MHTLGQFPLPVEVIPMARSHVARELVKLGGDPIYREGVVTDNGNVILDVYNFPIPQPLAMEQKINNITGVVTNGLFALRPADVLLLGTASGVRTLTPSSFSSWWLYRIAACDEFTRASPRSIDDPRRGEPHSPGCQPATRVATKTSRLKIKDLSGIHNAVRIKGELDLPHDLDLQGRAAVVQVVFLQQAHTVLG